MDYEKRLVKCPGCQTSQAAEFTHDHHRILAKGPQKCVHCHNWFQGVAEVRYAARFLNRHEIIKLKQQGHL